MVSTSGICGETTTVNTPLMRRGGGGLDTLRTWQCHKIDSYKPLPKKEVRGAPLDSADRHR